MYRRHSPPSVFSRRVAGGGAALPVPTRRLVPVLLPPRRRRGAGHGETILGHEARMKSKFLSRIAFGFTSSGAHSIS